MTRSCSTKPMAFIGWAVVSFAAACGGGDVDDSATASGAVRSTPPPSTGGELERRPAPPAISATAAPNEDSPGNYSGIITCNQPHAISFSGAASEIVTIEATIVSLDSAGNPSVTLVEGDVPVAESGNPVSISGEAQGETTVTGRRTYNFRHAATYGLKLEVEQCGHYRYQVAIHRDVAAAPNLTRETAEAITVGTPVRGTIGCEEHRWYAINTTRRTTFHVATSGTSRIAEGSGELSVAVVDANGAPVVASGNPLTAGGPIPGAGTPTSRDVTIARAGHYFLDVSYGSSCTIADYELAITR